MPLSFACDGGKLFGTCELRNLWAGTDGGVRFLEDDATGRFSGDNGLIILWDVGRGGAQLPWLVVGRLRLIEDLGRAGETAIPSE